MMREWLVDTIPAQLADLRGVLVAMAGPTSIATDPSMWGPIVVLWEAERIPVALASIADGAADPRTAGAAVRVRPAGAPLGARARLASATFTAPGRARRRARIWRAVDDVSRRQRPRRRWANRSTASPPACRCTSSATSASSTTAAATCRRASTTSATASATRAGASQPRVLDAIPTERPWVHVTESTLAYGDPFLLRAAIEALAGEPRGADHHDR